MNNEPNIDKIFIRQNNETSYIIHIVANETQLWIQLENKINGDIWCGEFSSQKIQQITQKAKNSKKFNMFIKMLLTSFSEKSSSVVTQILTYAQLQKKMNLARKTSNNQNNRKFLIMTYNSQFERTYYPLPLLFDQNPSADRLKVTIRRLSQELQLNCQQKGDSDIRKYMKQVSMLKYQNQTLIAKLKKNQSKLHFQSKQNQNINKSNLMEETEQLKKMIQNLKKFNENKDIQIQTLKSKLIQQNKQMIKKDNIILNLKEQITELKQEVNQKQNNKQFEQFTQKLAQMAKETSELVSQLQHSREQQKKSTLRILNLEKQLENMITLQQQKKNNNNKSKYVIVDSSPMRSSRKSEAEKSQKSFKSQSSKKSYNSNNSKNSKNSKTNPLISYLTKNKALNKKPATKKSSVYDSDTQSSKMRRMANNKVSPFRQTSKPTNNSPKNKNGNPLNNNRLQSGRNIANNFQTRNRSRSKSKSVKKQVSPPQNIYDDGSSDQEGVTQTLAVLRARRQNPKRSQHVSRSNVLGPVQQKISKIAQMLRNAKKKE